MPLLALGKQGFDPPTAFAIRFLVGFGRGVRPHPIEHLLIHTAAQAAPLGTGGTLLFERTVVAVFGACAIAARALGSLSLRKVQFFACWADVDITLCIVLELLRAKEFRAMIVIRKGNVGTEVLAL